MRSKGVNSTEYGSHASYGRPHADRLSTDEVKSETGVERDLNDVSARTYHRKDKVLVP